MVACNANSRRPAQWGLVTQLGREYHFFIWLIAFVATGGRTRSSFHLASGLLIGEQFACFLKVGQRLPRGVSQRMRQKDHLPVPTFSAAKLHLEPEHVLSKKAPGQNKSQTPGASSSSCWVEVGSFKNPPGEKKEKVHWGSFADS